MRVTSAHAAVLALELARTPTLAAPMRLLPLPCGILTVIRLASGCLETSAAIERAVGCDPTFARDAAILYIQEVMFHDVDDSYRVLGIRPDDDLGLLREHFITLMKWLHPDSNGKSWESAFAIRVSAAWNALKTPHRRADYNRRAAAAGEEMVNLKHQPAKRHGAGARKLLPPMD